VSGLVHVRRAGGNEFQILLAAMLKLWAPNEVTSFGARSSANKWNREQIGISYLKA